MKLSWRGFGTSLCGVEKFCVFLDQKNMYRPSFWPQETLFPDQGKRCSIWCTLVTLENGPYAPVARLLNPSGRNGFPVAAQGTGSL
eukprot:5902191-Amphidinium_carterae.1